MNDERKICPRCGRSKFNSNIPNDICAGCTTEVNVKKVKMRFELEQAAKNEWDRKHLTLN